ncbi:MAG: hypothetical protein WCW93_01645 [Candidatus Paceibacterota bacterium]
MILRISAFILLLFSILFMPFWLSVVIALCAMIYFNVFWEAIVLFLLSDLLYGIPETKFFNMVFVSSIVILIVLIIIEAIKKKLKFYK